jgi:hypothetical protein
VSARYLVNLEPKRVRSIARLLRRLAERRDQFAYKCPPGATFVRARRESKNLMACADAADALLRADLEEKKWRKK